MNYKIPSLENLRRHWRLSTILEASNKSLWNNVFWYVKVCIFWSVFNTLYIKMKHKSLKDSLRTK